MGDGFSIAWRQLDAQYWGVPQRRKRIYLVADFRGGRAGEILFERESMRGNPAACGAPEKDAAANAAGSAGRGRCARCLNPWDTQSIRQYAVDGVFPTLAASSSGGQNRAGVCFKIGQGAKARSLGESETVTPTLGSEAGGNSVPGICYPQVARMLTAEAASPCIDRGQNVVCYDARGNGDGTHCPTLTGDHENRITDYTALCIGHGEPNSITMANQANTLTCMHDQQAVLTSGKPPRKYIIRRLTPLECCRLQGFPDGWGVPDRKDRLTNEELEFWQGVRDTCASIAEKPPKKYSAKSLTRWYNALHTDSAEYKMWGNGIALPCAAFVLGNVAKHFPA